MTIEAKPVNELLDEQHKKPLWGKHTILNWKRNRSDATKHAGSKCSRTLEDKQQTVITISPFKPFKSGLIHLFNYFLSTNRSRKQHIQPPVYNLLQLVSVFTDRLETRHYRTLVKGKGDFTLTDS